VGVALNFIAVGFTQSLTTSRVTLTVVVWLLTLGTGLIAGCIIAKLMRLYILFKYAVQMMRAISLLEMLSVVVIICGRVVCHLRHAVWLTRLSILYYTGD